MNISFFGKIVFIVTVANIVVCNVGFSQAEKLQSQTLTKAFSYIQNLYIDSINSEEIVENAILAMLKNLDPHSQYISKDNVKMVDDLLKGNLEGIGIQFNILEDTVFIINPIKDGPAAREGIMPGDKIITAEKQNISGTGINNESVKKIFTGLKGTKIDIGIKRSGEAEMLHFSVEREKIPINSIVASYLVDDKTGYIKLNSFSSTTISEFDKAMSNFMAFSIENLILDLRGNGGGYLQTAAELCDHFIDNKKLIVFTEGMHSNKKEIVAKIDGSFEKGKLAILINEGSASASEIVAGAVQDWDRGIIIGRRSFGKGLVQRPLDLPDGSRLRLTVAHYYTPTGRSIQKSFNKGNIEYKYEIINRYNHGEFSNRDSIHFPDSLKYETLINKRTIYGGGGIMPDIFMPLDTGSFTNYFQELFGKGIIHLFAFKYANDYRHLFKQEYSTFEKYKTEFNVSEEMFEELLSIAKENNIVFKKSEYLRSKEEIRINILALIASNLFNNNNYYEIINSTDKVLLKATEILSNKKSYKKILSGK